MELSELIEQIEERKRQIDGYGPLAPDQLERLEQKIRIDWTYHSNALEGNQLTYGDTRSLLIWGLTAKGKPIRDHLDIEGHNEAIKRLEALARQETPLTVTLVKEFHRLVLAEPFNEYRQDVLVGQYKKEGNYLYNHRGERVDFCPPDEVPQRLNDLLNWTNNAINPPKRSRKEYAIHPLLVATRFHLDFVNIHPFDDGNGRMARIFSNLILMQCGYPPYIVPVTQREEYVQAIQLAREEGLDVLATFIGERLVDSLNLYLRAAQGLSVNEPADLDRQISLLTRQLEVHRPAQTLNERQSQLKMVMSGLGTLLTITETLLVKLQPIFNQKSIIPSFIAIDSNGQTVTEKVGLDFDAIIEGAQKGVLSTVFDTVWFSGGTTKVGKLRALIGKFEDVRELRYANWQTESPFVPLYGVAVDTEEIIQFDRDTYSYQCQLSWNQHSINYETVFLYEWREPYDRPPDIDDFNQQLAIAIQGILKRIEERLTPNPPTTNGN